MDNLCHSLVGLAMADAGGKRLTPRVTATLVLAANLPDLDAVFAFAPLGLMVRRGITHGLPALVLLPVWLTLAILAWDRWRREVLEVAAARAGGVLVSPVFAASWRRTVIVARADRYEVGGFDATAHPALRLGEFAIPRGRQHASVVAKSGDPRARAFLGWTRFPFYRREGDPVMADDVRYTTGAPSFARVVVLVTTP